MISIEHLSRQSLACQFIRRSHFPLKSFNLTVLRELHSEKLHLNSVKLVLEDGIRCDLLKIYPVDFTGDLPTLSLFTGSLKELSRKTAGFRTLEWHLLMLRISKKI